MATLLQDVRYALRMLIKSPGFAAVAVMSLALGIGANTTIFTVVNRVLLNPLPIQDSSRLVELDTTDKKTLVTQANATKMGVSFPNYEDYARQNNGFTGLAAFTFVTFTLSGRGEPKQFQGMLVSANYFDVLGVKPVLGRTFFPEEDKQPGGNAVAVLSFSLWAHEFGADPGLIGKTLTLNGQPYTVIGVAPRGFKGTLVFTNSDEIWIPTSMHTQALSGFLEENFHDRRFLDFFCLGRLRPGVSIAQAEAAIETVAARLEQEYPKDNGGRSVALSPLTDAAVGINQRNGMVLAGSVMMGVVGLVLLIACVNLANLLLTQAARREKEMSIRAALGASAKRLMRQSLTESLVLSLLGGAVGLVIAYWGSALLWSLRPAFLAQSDLDLSLNGRVLAFTFGLSLITATLFGMVPALRAARPDLNETLKAGGRGGTMRWTRSRLRNTLVISEVALALMALVGAGLFLRSLRFAERLDPGFLSRSVFTMNFDLGSQHYDEGHGEQFFRDVVERSMSVSGVQSAAVASNPPLGGGISRTVFLEGQSETTGQRGTLTLLDSISSGYFQTMGISLLQGRTFSDLDRANTLPVAIVNRAMARHFWPNADPIGKRFHFFGETALREVVGEVGDTVQFQIGEEPQPVVYLPLAQDYSPVATLHVRTQGNPESAIASVRAQVQSLDRNLALTNVTTMDAALGQGLWAPRMGAALLSVFGLLALVLAAVGIYGVLSYSVSQQTHEIGIRMALGAEPGRVLRLVVGQGVRLIAIGLVAGLLASIVCSRLLAGLLFGVKPSDPVTFAAVAAVLVAMGLLACYVPARRATKVDPVVALRYE